MTTPVISIITVCYNAQNEIAATLKSVKEQEGIVGAHCENGDLVNSLIKDNLNNKNISS